VKPGLFRGVVYRLAIEVAVAAAIVLVIWARRY
jgi:hypothetical protein